jgi:hypothetical protein
MGSVRFLFGVFCFIAFGRCGYAGCGAIGHRFVKHQKENGYERVVRIAEKEIGIREEGAENCGRRVEEYLKCVGFGKGAPWCAAFVSFVFKEAGFGQPRTAWSPGLFPEGRVVKCGSRDPSLVGMTREKTKSANSMRSIARRERGAIRSGLVFGIYFPSLGRIGHCGIVSRVSGDNIYTVKGNTSAAGSREGDGVYRRIRNRRTVAKFSDWVN